MKPNFRGLRKVVMVDVLEGNGTTIPYRTVHYIFDLDQHGGSHGGLVGKIDVYEQGLQSQQSKETTPPQDVTQ